jgi:nicotinamidase-related amidase
MKMINLDYNKTVKTLVAIQEGLNNKETLDIGTLDIKSTVIVVVDMINGFCKVGNLYSDRNEKLISPVVEVLERIKNYKKIFFRDYHTEDSTEFNTYPKHCLNELESDIVEELKKFIDKNAVIINKNSVNGFLTDKFQRWLELNEEIETFIIIGDCTDICVLNFALSLKCYLDENNRKGEVVIFTDLVETFDLDATNHYGDLMNLFALYNMEMNGVKIFKNIKGEELE